MATRSCPQCGTQYVATVRRCIDCDLVLVDEVTDETDDRPSVSAAAPMGSGEQVGYELGGWGNQLKVTLEGMLGRAGIGRVWEAGALVVAAADEDAVDELIATLEGDEVPDLDDDVPRVALEIEGLDADAGAELDAQLLASAVPHAWDDHGVLLVAEADEERVLALIDQVFEAPQDDGDDGLAAQSALSALYVAVDRLAKHPHGRKPVAAFVRAAERFEGLSVPYGFATADWDDLVREAEELAASVAVHAGGADSEPSDGDDTEDDASADTDTDTDEPGDDAADDATTSALDQSREAALALRARLTDLV